MPQRHRPYRSKVKGCYECSQRRINCDRGKPECAKCVSKHLKCSGLGIRHRFSNGIAARGKWVGKTAQSVYAERLSAELQTSPHLATSAWTTSVGDGLSGLPDSSLTQNINAARPMSTRNPSLPHHAGGQTDQTDDTVQADVGSAPEYIIKKGITVSETPFTILDHVPDVAEEDEDFSGEESIVVAPANMFRFTALQPTPGNLPLWKRILILNFSENIAKEMVAIDGLHNGWRHLVLPVAYTDDLVLSAVLAVSAFHTLARETKVKGCHPAQMTSASYYHVKSQQYPDCESLYAQTITGLRHRQELGKYKVLDQHLVLMTILVLLVAVLVTGSDDFPILFRMLQSAFEVIGGEGGLGRGDLAEFIIRQVHKMNVYAAPFISEENGLRTISSPKHVMQGFECMMYCSQQRPDAAGGIPLVISLVQQARGIYLRQALRESALPPSPVGQIPDPVSDSISRVQRFKETLEAFPKGSPGEQVLIWATFIAASDCILDEHKSFFEDVFLRYFIRSGFVNVLSGLKHLRSIWARKAFGGRWTSFLPQANIFVM